MRILQNDRKLIQILTTSHPRHHIHVITSHHISSHLCSISQISQIFINLIQNTKHKTESKEKEIKHKSHRHVVVVYGPNHRQFDRYFCLYLHQILSFLFVDREEAARPMKGNVIGVEMEVEVSPFDQIHHVLDQIQFGTRHVPTSYGKSKNISNFHFFSLWKNQNNSDHKRAKEKNQSISNELFYDKEMRKRNKETEMRERREERKKEREREERGKENLSSTHSSSPLSSFHISPIDIHSN